MMLSICEPELGTTFAQSLLDGGVEKTSTVCGVERLDEISCAGPSHVWELTKDENGEGEIDENLVNPKNNFGLPIHLLEDEAGHILERNARVFIGLLYQAQSLSSGAEKETIQEHTTVTNFVLINTLALPVVTGIAEDFKHGVGLAKENTTSRKAREALQTLR